MFHSILSLLLAPMTAMAAPLDCPINNFSVTGFQLSCWGAGAAGFNALADVIANSINPIVSNLFGSLVFIMTLVYSLALIIGSTDENAVSEGRRAFIFALVGGFIVAFQGVILNAVFVNTSPSSVRPLPSRSSRFAQSYFLRREATKEESRHNANCSSTP